MIYALGGSEPQVDPTATVDYTAVVIGRVALGPGVTVGPRAVLRGDDGPIDVGARSVIASGAVLHVFPGLPTRVGEDCVIGQLAHLEGCVVEAGVSVGCRAVVLPGATVQTGARVGPRSLVPMWTEIPAGSEAVGVPARIQSGGLS